MKRIHVKKVLAVLAAIVLYAAFAVLYMALPREGRSALFGMMTGYVLWDLCLKVRSLRKG